jgi:threonine/homoserine/homoserine lactone efflux protein
LDFSFLISGIIIGFSIAAPVGPIGVLCIRRTLAEGRLHGLVSGLGAATADAVYGCIAAFGLTFISDVLVQQQLWLRIIGGAFLIFLGVKTILSKPSEKPSSEKRTGLLTAYGSTFFLTLTNPRQHCCRLWLRCTVGVQRIFGFCSVVASPKRNRGHTKEESYAASFDVD